MLYLDVDAICKLAHWKILPELPGLLRHPWEKMVTLSALHYRACRSTERLDERLFHSHEAAKMVCELSAQMAQPASPNIDILVALTGAGRIDAGEATLFAMAVNDPEGVVITGDKRALRGLSELDCATSFAGRVFTVEQIVLLCLAVLGRAWLLANICPYRELDKAISIILGAECNAETSNIESGLKSYIQEVAELHNPTLLGDIGQYASV